MILYDLICIYVIIEEQHVPLLVIRILLQDPQNHGWAKETVAVALPLQPSGASALIGAASSKVLGSAVARSLRKKSLK